MKTYKIIGKTNGWIAQRDSMFQGKTEVLIESSLTLKESHQKLLDMYNERFSEERPYASNWGIAVIQSARQVDGAAATSRNGTRSFDYDGRIFSIEEETEQ